MKGGNRKPFPVIIFTLCVVFFILLCRQLWITWLVSFAWVPVSPTLSKRSGRVRIARTDGVTFIENQFYTHTHFYDHVSNDSLEKDISSPLLVYTTSYFLFYIGWHLMDSFELLWTLLVKNIYLFEWLECLWWRHDDDSPKSWAFFLLAKLAHSCPVEIIGEVKDN